MRIHRVAAFAVLVGLAACTGTTRVAIPASTVSSATTTTSESSTVATAAGRSATIAPDFRPVSVSFVSARRGFVLGSYSCPNAHCFQLAQTADHGATWTAIATVQLDALPTEQSARLRFADLNNGWIISAAGLLATHDGGLHWARAPIVTQPGATVMTMEAGNHVAHAVVAGNDANVVIVSSPIDGDHWTGSPTNVSLGAGPVPGAQIVLHGSDGWMVENDRTVVGGARLHSGRWTSWDPPCRDGGGPANLTATEIGTLVAVCQEGVWFGNRHDTRVFESTDGGATFGAISTLDPNDSCPCAASSAVVVVVVPIPHATVGLLASFDHGRSWIVVDRGPAAGYHDLGMTTRTQGVVVAVGDGTSPNRLLMTYDGGHHWRTVLPSE